MKVITVIGVSLRRPSFPLCTATDPSSVNVPGLLSNLPPQLYYTSLRNERPLKLLQLYSIICSVWWVAPHGQLAIVPAVMHGGSRLAGIRWCKGIKAALEILSLIPRLFS